MLVIANFARITFFLAMLVGGFAILWAGPAPFLELVQGQRVLATTWDVFAWWFAVLAIFIIIVRHAGEPPTTAASRRMAAPGFRLGTTPERGHAHPAGAASRVA